MSFYYFTFETSKESQIGKKVSLSQSTLIVPSDNFGEANIKAINYIQNRSKFTGNLQDYNLLPDWVENRPRL